MPESEAQDHGIGDEGGQTIDDGDVPAEGEPVPEPHRQQPVEDGAPQGLPDRPELKGTRGFEHAEAQLEQAADREEQRAHDDAGGRKASLHREYCNAQRAL